MKVETVMKAQNKRKNVRPSGIRYWHPRSKCCRGGMRGCISSRPAAGLGGGRGPAGVKAAGTPEQRAKFLARFAGEKPTVAAMCMTEAGAGSDTSAIRARAVLGEKTHEWGING